MKMRLLCHLLLLLVPISGTSGIMLMRRSSLREKLQVNILLEYQYNVDSQIY
jgi:hypothetical protein